MVSVPSTFTLVYWLFHRTQPVWILCPDMGLSFPWDETCQWGLVFWGKRWGKLQIQWSRIILFRLVLFSWMLISGSDGKNPQIMYSSWEKSWWNIHVDLMNWTFFGGLQLASFCWRRASATAVVAVVFLADRLNKHMLTKRPGRWTCAGCNALAALLCDMVFQNNDSVGSCWKICPKHIHLLLKDRESFKASGWDKKSDEQMELIAMN